MSCTCDTATWWCLAHSSWGRKRGWLVMQGTLCGECRIGDQMEILMKHMYSSHIICISHITTSSPCTHRIYLCVSKNEQKITSSNALIWKGAVRAFICTPSKISHPQMHWMYSGGVGPCAYMDDIDTHNACVGAVWLASLALNAHISPCSRARSRYTWPSPPNTRQATPPMSNKNFLQSTWQNVHECRGRDTLEGSTSPHTHHTWHRRQGSCEKKTESKLTNAVSQLLSSSIASCQLYSRPFPTKCLDH